jgi:hypothetical protein
MTEFWISFWIITSLVLDLSLQGKLTKKNSLNPNILHKITLFWLWFSNIWRKTLDGPQNEYVYAPL